MATQPKETFGQRVKRLREAKISYDALGKETETTQAMLADECGCSVDTISRIERDVQKPSTSTLFALAKAFGMSVDELMKDL